MSSLPVRQLFGNSRYNLRHNKVLDKLVRIIKNYMKSEPTISPQKFVTEKGKIYTGSKQTNIEPEPVKIFLDQVEIWRDLPTDLDGILITQKQYLVRACNKILFFCRGRNFKSSQ